jgi:hypothetical protein
MIKQLALPLSASLLLGLGFNYGAWAYDYVQRNKANSQRLPETLESETTEFLPWA